MDESREPVRNDNEVMCVRFTPHPLYLNSSKQYGRDYRIITEHPFKRITPMTKKSRDFRKGWREFKKGAKNYKV